MLRCTGSLADIWDLVLADETETAMRLLGVKTVSELSPRHVNTSALVSTLFEGPSELDEIERQLRPKL